MRTEEQEPRQEEREREIARFRGLTPAAAAEVAGVSEDTVRAWIERGELTARDVGTRTRPRYRIKLADLEACLARRTRNPEAAA